MIRWLHISDLHIKNKADWNSYRKELLKKCSEIGKINLVIVTGDFHDFSDGVDFEYAKSFLRELVKKLELDIGYDLFLIPGNHDGVTPIADKKLYVFFAYSISSFIVTFPICDKIHFLTGSLIAILAICYMLYDDFIVGSQYSKVFKLICYGAYSFTTIFLVLLLLFESVHSVNRDFIKVDKEKELNHFYYIPENVGLKDRIFEIDDYIMDNKRNGKNVYMLDAEAALYTIPLDIYNKDYDMFLKGNLGSKGEDGIIERIQKEENAVYLLKMDYLNWQNPNKVRDYIMSNLNYKGNISIFYIYEK